MKAPVLMKIETLSGAYTAICRADGRLLPETPTVLRQAVQQGRAELLYADETVEGPHGDVQVKKVGFAPDTMLSYDCMGSPLFIAASLRARIGLPERFDAPGIYAYGLRAASVAHGVQHIPAALFRGAPCKPFDGVTAVQRVLTLRGRSGIAAQGLFRGSTMVRYGLRRDDVLSVIVTGGTDAAAVRRTLEAVERYGDGVQTELIAVIGGLPGPRAAAYYDALEASHAVRVLRAPGECNDARLKNIGASAARGEQLLFLAAGVAPVSQDTLPAMAAQARQPQTGAVGGKVTDAQEILLHTGLTAGQDDVPADPCAGRRDASGGAMLDAGARCIRNVSLLGGDAFLIGTERFFSAGRFDETFDTRFCEAALCVRLMEKRLHNVYTPFAHFRASGEGALPARGPLSARNAERCRDLFRELRVYGDPHWPWAKKVKGNP